MHALLACSLKLQTMLKIIDMLKSMLNLLLMLLSKFMLRIKSTMKTFLLTRRKFFVKEYLCEACC